SLDDLQLTGKNRVAVAHESHVAIEDLGSDSHRLLKGAPSGPILLTVSSDGGSLVAGGMISQKLVTWSGPGLEHSPTPTDPRKWKLHVYDAPYSLAISRDGRTLLEVTDTGRLDVWQVGRSEPPRVIRTRGRPLAVAFTRSGEAMVVGSDGAVYRLD